MALATSTSAVHRSVARLQHAGICGAGSRTVLDASLHEFLVYGARYAFPAVHGPERSGMPTAGAHPELASVLGDGEPVRSLVWPMEGGPVRGETLVPLFNGVTKVAVRDPRLHKMLACVDAIRVGSVRQRGSASELLQHLITTRVQ